MPEVFDSGSFTDRIGTGGALGEDKLGVFVLGTSLTISQIVEDVGKIDSFVSVNKELLISDLIGSLENAVVESFIEVFDYVSADDIMNLVVDIEIMDYILGQIEIPNIGFIVLDIGNFTDRLGTGSILGEGKLGIFVLGTTFTVLQIAEDVGISDSLIEIDSNVRCEDLGNGHEMGHWKLGYYHEVDKSIIVGPVNRSTNVRFKRRSVKKR